MPSATDIVREYKAKCATEPFARQEVIGRNSLDAAVDLFRIAHLMETRPLITPDMTILPSAVEIAQIRTAARALIFKHITGKIAPDFAESVTQA